MIRRITDDLAEFSSPTTRSRREIIRYGFGGSLGLLCPRIVIGNDGDDGSLGARLDRELKKLEEDYLARIPDEVRKAAVTAFDSNISDSILEELSNLNPPPIPLQRAAIKNALDSARDKVGDICQTSVDLTLSGENLFSAISTSKLGQRLAQPTFQYPFTPEFTWDIRLPELSTSQSGSDMFQNLLDRKDIFDPTQLSLRWRVLKFVDSSLHDRIEAELSIEADHFLNESFQIIAPQWHGDLDLSWRMFQNGAVNFLNWRIEGRRRWRLSARKWRLQMVTAYTCRWQ
jgi:hypothetical protein